MNIPGHWWAGLKVIPRQPAALVWNYLASLLAALPVALVVGWLVDGRFRSSLMADRFARGVDAELVVELLQTEAKTLQTLGALALGLLPLWALLSTYLGGATLVAVGQDSPQRTGQFLSGGGKVFGRLLRLWVLGWPYLALVAGGLGWGLMRTLGEGLEDWTSERSVLAVRLATLAGAALIWVWAHGAYELMKIEAVTKGEYRARWAFVRGLSRALRHPVALLALYAPFLGGLWGVTLLGSLLDVQIPRVGWGMILAGALFGQALALIRTALRMGWWGAAVTWVKQKRLNPALRPDSRLRSDGADLT